jgi:uridine kinase
MLLIGIAGPSCAGKGTLCHWLAQRLPASVLPLDAYYFPLDHLSLEERSRKNFDDPSSLDEALLAAHLAALRGGSAVNRPVYDFTRHTRAAECVRLEPHGYLLIEGLFTLYWERVRGLLSASIFITAPDGVCLDRRLDRDQRERGRTAQSVVSQYQTTVSPMRSLFVDPTSRYADLVLDGTHPVEQNGPRALEYLRTRFGR